MSKIAILPTLLVTAFVGLLPAVQAQAQAARTFVSAAGLDSNSCTGVTTPCRHLAAAYAATAANGEIYVLDPANYGSLTITGPVSIEGHGWASIAPVIGGNAITINAPGATDKINIIGVVLDGTGLDNTNGIMFNSGGSLNIRDSVIRNFGNNGIYFVPNNSNPSRLSVSNTLVTDNFNVGIAFIPTGSGTADCVVDHVLMENNGSTGLTIGGISNTDAVTLNVTVSDSVAAQNGNAGIFAQGSAALTYVAVRRSNISNNGISDNGVGVEAVGNTIIRLSQSVMTGNSTGWTIVGGGSVGSTFDNLIDDNTNGNGGPPTLAYK